MVRRGRLTGSGLVIFSQVPVVRSIRRTFHERGSRLWDSDAHASKGFTMVELGGPAEGVEVVVTHLHAGGWGIGHRSPDHGAEMRSAQLRQLVDVVGSAHRPGNLLLVGGDFNVDPDRPSADEPDVTAAMAALGLVDLWSAHGSGPGWTAPGHRLEELAAPDLADDRFAADAVGHLDRQHELQRIDLVFGPSDLHDVVIRRRGFPAPDMATSRLTTLSDHLALHVEVPLG
jgi:endonuclease/exonuclease/phosphatase family metal-dependent hydrolase